MSHDALASVQLNFLHLTLRDDGTVGVNGASTGSLGRQVPSSSRGGLPDGSWVRWHWDGLTLTVENDALGYRPLYFATTSGGICLSPDLSEVVERTGATRWNPTAIGVFCRAGIWPGNETAFMDIQLLPPNSTLTWRAGRTVISTRAIEFEAIVATRSEAMDGFVRRVREAIMRRLPQSGEQAWLPLSGGRDSRHLLLELIRAGVRPRCISARYRPPGTTEDADIAGRLCSALSQVHETIDTTPNWFTGECRKNRLVSYASPAHSWFLPLAERMTEIGGVAYDGIGGDATLNGYFLEPQLMRDFSAGRLAEVANRFLPIEKERVVRRWFGDFAYDAMPRKAAVERLANDLALYQHRPTPVSSWAMEARARRGVVVTQYGFLRRLAAVMSPYMDLDVYRFVIGLPWELLADKNLHTETIYREFPEVANIPFAAKGKQQRLGAAREYRRRARDFFGYLIKQPNSELLNIPYLAARTARSAIDGSLVPSIPILLIQLEREEGLRLG